VTQYLYIYRLTWPAWKLKPTPSTTNIFTYTKEGLFHWMLFEGKMKVNIQYLKLTLYSDYDYLSLLRIVFSSTKIKSPNLKTLIQCMYELNPATVIQAFSNRLIKICVPYFNMRSRKCLPFRISCYSLVFWFWVLMVPFVWLLGIYIFYLNTETGRLYSL